MKNLAWVINIILPLGIILYGYLYKNIAYKKISYFFGYKTARSQTSEETWEYANKRVGAMWMKLGGIYTLIVILILLLFPSQREKPSIIIMLMAIGVSMIPFPIVQRELDEKFDEEGKAIKKDKA